MLPNQFTCYPVVSVPCTCLAYQFKEILAEKNCSNVEVFKICPGVVCLCVMEEKRDKDRNKEKKGNSQFMGSRFSANIQESTSC